MDNLSNAECEALLACNKRISALLNLTDEYKGEPKKLKLCAKFAKSERKEFEKRKIAVSVDDKRNIIWRYDEFIKIIVALGKTNDHIKYTRARDDLDALIKKVGTEAVALKIRSGTDASVKAATDIAAKIKNETEKVGAMVSGAIDKLKKAIKENNSE